MMDILEKYYHEHKQVFNECLARIPVGYKVEDVHEMRTSIKRLRALLQLVEFLSDSQFSTKKYLKRERKLFKSVGTLREIQVEEMLVYYYEEKLGLDFSEYSEYLFEKEHREIGKLKRNFGKIKGDSVFNDTNLTEALRSIDIETVQERTQAFVKRKSNTLLKINQKAKITERVHKNRTILKQIYYLYDIIVELSGWHIFLGMTKEEIREKEQQIGEWHDRVNSLYFLELFFMKYHFKPPEKYQQLKQFIFKERDDMKKEIVKHLFVGQTELWDE